MGHIKIDRYLLIQKASRKEFFAKPKKKKTQTSRFDGSASPSRNI
jgi:hypothetical protein